MESDILDSLNDLGYPEEVYKDEEFKKMLQEGPSVAFTKVCRFLHNLKTDLMNNVLFVLFNVAMKYKGTLLFFIQISYLGTMNINIFPLFYFH